MCSYHHPMQWRTKAGVGGQPISLLCLRCGWLCKSHQQQQHLQLFPRVCEQQLWCFATEAGLEPRQLNQSRQNLCHGLHKPTASGSTLQEKNDLLIFVSVVIDNSCIQRRTNGTCQGQSQMSPWASMSECLPRPSLLPSMGQVRFSCPCSLLGWQHLLYHCLLLTWIPACPQGLPCARLKNVFHVYWDLHSFLKNEHPAFR